MRYVIRILAMAPVLGFTIYAVWLLYADRKLTNVLWVVVMYVLLVLLGFFECWKPSMIKKFMKNSKRMGL